MSDKIQLNDVTQAIENKDIKTLEKYIANGGDLDDLRIEQDNVMYRLTALHYYLLWNIQTYWANCVTYEKMSHFSQLYNISTANSIPLNSILDKILTCSKNPKTQEKMDSIFKFLLANCNVDAEVQVIDDPGSPRKPTRGLTAADLLVLCAKHLLMRTIARVGFGFDETLDGKAAERNDYLYNLLKQIFDKTAIDGNSYSQLLLEPGYPAFPDYPGFKYRGFKVQDRFLSTYKKFVALAAEHEIKCGAKLYTEGHTELFEVLPAAKFCDYLQFYTKNSPQIKAATFFIPYCDYTDGKVRLAAKIYKPDLLIKQAYDLLAKNVDSDELYPARKGIMDWDRTINGLGALLSFFTKCGSWPRIVTHYISTANDLEQKGMQLLRRKLKEYDLKHPYNKEEDKRRFINLTLNNSALKPSNKFYYTILNLFLEYNFPIAPRRYGDYLSKVIDTPTVSLLLDKGLIDANHLITVNNIEICSYSSLIYENNKKPRMPYIFFVLNNDIRINNGLNDKGGAMLLGIRRTLDLFLSYGLDINICDSNGTSLSYYLIKRIIDSATGGLRQDKDFIFELLKLLSEKGAVFSKKNKYGHDFYDLCHVRKMVEDRPGEYTVKRLQLHHKLFHDIAKEVEKTANRETAIETASLDEWSGSGYEW